MKVSVVLVDSESSLLGLQMTFLLCPQMAFSLHACFVEISSFYEDPSHIG